MEPKVDDSDRLERILCRAPAKSSATASGLRHCQPIPVVQFLWAASFMLCNVRIMSYPSHRKTHEVAAALQMKIRLGLITVAQNPQNTKITPKKKKTRRLVKVRKSRILYCKTAEKRKATSSRKQASRQKLPVLLQLNRIQIGAALRHMFLFENRRLPFIPKVFSHVSWCTGVWMFSLCFTFRVFLAKCRYGKAVSQSDIEKTRATKVLMPGPHGMHI